MFGGQPTPPDSDHAGTTLFYLVSAFVALALPTTLMGATLPMLARYAVAEEAQIGRRIGLLYAMNTAGAVVGALLTAFVLLPELGLDAHDLGRRRAQRPRVPARRGAGAAHAVREAAPRDTRSMRRAAAAPRAHPHALASTRFPGPAWVLPLMLLAGAVAFFQEVLWTRMLAHVVGSSIYAFGVMVASFLTGIALGGGARRGASRGIARARRAGAGARADRRRGRRRASPIYVSRALLPDTAGLLANIDVHFGFVHVPERAVLRACCCCP